MRGHSKEGCKGGSSLEQSPQSCGYGPKLLEFKKSLKMLSEKWFQFWVVLYGARGWTESFWVPSDFGHSIVLRY